MEIERKFLLNKEDIPIDLSTLRTSGIRQGYLNPDDTYIIRVRGTTPLTNPLYVIPHKREEYVMTIKSKGLLLREEFEFPIKEDKFTEILEKCNRKIAKIRYYIREKNYLYEIDEYIGISLWTIEVEFKSEEEANNFIPPNWFGEDVTKDDSYKNVNLSL